MRRGGDRGVRRQVLLKGILRLAIEVIFFAYFAHPLRSLRLKFFTARDAKIYAKKNVRLLPGEGIIAKIVKVPPN